MAIFFIIMCSYDQVKEQKSDFLTFFFLYSSEITTQRFYVYYMVKIHDTYV